MRTNISLLFKFNKSIIANEIVAAEKMKMKMSRYTEEEKCRIAEWMFANTPTGRLIGLEWQPYLMKQINDNKKKNKNVKKYDTYIVFFFYTFGLLKRRLVGVISVAK